MHEYLMDLDAFISNPCQMEYHDTNKLLFFVTDLIRLFIY